MSESDDLLLELEDTLSRINRVIEEVEYQSINKDEDPEQMRYADGKYIMVPLLLAKSNILPLLYQLKKGEEVKTDLVDAREEMKKAWDELWANVKKE